MPVSDESHPFESICWFYIYPYVKNQLHTSKSVKYHFKVLWAYLESTTPTLELKKKNFPKYGLVIGHKTNFHWLFLQN